MGNLPIPSAAQQVHSQQLCEIIALVIAKSGWISFADFMHMALYTPGLGYYSGGAQKFGLEGDFVTAPEISPLFAQTIARQAAPILAVSDGDILELGAGTGKLAADLLLELAELKQLPNQYFILEVSDYLRQSQRETCHAKLPKPLFEKLVWIDKLPPSPQPSAPQAEGEGAANIAIPFNHCQPSPPQAEGEGAMNGFCGLILANEVLDALPVHLIVKNKGELFERGVVFEGDFVWQEKPLKNKEIAQEAHGVCLPEQYLTEFCPAAKGLVNSLAEVLTQGVILLIDYGFSAREYYHPQRDQGTLMCHFQHFAHDNPLINIGLQDITAHVNFSKLAEEAHGIRLAGYVTQAQFLINCGMLDIMAQHSPDSPQFMQLAAAAQKLLSPAEMGELFKVMAFTKNCDLLLIGFAEGDKRHTL